MPGWWVETISAPSPADITITGGTPSVTASQNKVLTPAPAAIHVTSHAPAPAGTVVTPGGTMVAAGGGTPAVKQDRPITPAGGTVTATGGSPSVVKGTRVTPAAPTVAATGGSPTVTNASPATYDAVGPSGQSFGSTISFNHTASAGADVFVAINWDRSGATIGGVTYGGVAMSLVASITHNNTSGSGGVAVYRLAGAGNGSAKSVAATVTGGAWYIANAVSAKSVTSMGTAVTAFGSSNTASQALTVPSGLVLQFVSSANAGSGVGDYTSFSGATNRWHLQGTGGAMAINTVTATGTASSTSSGSQPWAAIAVPLT